MSFKTNNILNQFFSIHTYLLSSLLILFVFVQQWNLCRASDNDVLDLWMNTDILSDPNLTQSAVSPSAHMQI